MTEMREEESFCIMAGFDIGSIVTSIRRWVELLCSAPGGMWIATSAGCRVGKDGTSPVGSVATSWVVTAKFAYGARWAKVM